MIRLLALLLSIFLLAGCSSVFEGRVLDSQAEIAEASDSALATATDSHASGSHSQFQSAYWFGDRPSPLRHGDPVPPSLASSAAVQLFVPSATGRSKLDLFTQSRSLLPFPIRIDPSTLDLASRDDSSRGPNTSSLIPAAGSTVLADSDPLRFVSGGYLNGDLDFPFDFNGTLAELVPALADALGFAGWYFDSDVIFLYLHQRRDYEYRIFAEDEAFWAEGVSLIESICSGQCSVNPLKALARFTVVAHPHILDRITLALDALNRRLTEAFVIDLRLYQIQSTFEDSFDFRLGAVLRDGLLRTGTGSALPIPAADAPLISPIGGNYTIGAIISGGFLQHSSVMIDTLSRLGVVSSLQATSLTVLNSREQTFTIDSEQTVLLNTTSTPTAGENVVQQFETATRNTGIKVKVKPQLIQGTDLLLDLVLTLTQVPSGPDPNEASGAGSAPVLSVQDQRVFSHQLRVRLGDLLVLNAYQTITANSSRQGTGRPDFWLLGGSRGASKTATTYVLTLRPLRLLDPPSVSVPAQ